MRKLHATVRAIAAPWAATLAITSAITWAIAGAVPAALAQDAAASAPSFRIVFDDSLRTEPYTGRVYVALLGSDQREPRELISSWFNPPPLFARDVEDVPPGGEVLIDGSAIAHPIPLDELEHRVWYAQAVARVNPDNPRPGGGEGDLISVVTRIDLADGAPEAPIELTLADTVPGREFPETERVREFEVISESLSAFHGREYRIRAGVILPDGWAPGNVYPIVYDIPGFGGNHFGALSRARRRGPNDPAGKCLYVVLDPQCYRGHSVFADSANNGPWGTALVEELIPALEAEFGGPAALESADPSRFRFVTGVSSGGWSSLWLQITYPDTFGACFSHVPDPVDFRDFQQVNLYEDENLYTLPNGERTPLARRRGEVMLWYDDFVARETAVGPGGQIHSFEAVFSPRKPDGTPLLIFDRETGAIDNEAARTWEKYDIRLILERNWDELGPKLEGKIHVYAGEVDTFYLEGAVELLKVSLEELGSDAVVEVIPGMAHQLHRAGQERMYELLLDRWESRGE
jgi:hypothetical protein